MEETESVYDEYQKINQMIGTVQEQWCLELKDLDFPVTMFDDQLSAWEKKRFFLYARIENLEQANENENGLLNGQEWDGQELAKS